MLTLFYRLVQYFRYKFDNSDESAYETPMATLDKFKMLYTEPLQNFSFERITLGERVFFLNLPGKESCIGIGERTAVDKFEDETDILRGHIQKLAAEVTLNTVFIPPHYMGVARD